MNAYLKSFLFLTIFNGFFMGLYFSTEHGLIAGSLGGLAYGLLFSAILMPAVVFVQEKHAVRFGKKGHEISPRQEMVLAVTLPAEEAFECCKSALQEFGAHIRRQGRRKEFIKATTDISWKSFGEVISVRLAGHDNGQLRVTIKSIPRLPTTLLDNGKGVENVTAIAALIGGEQIKKEVENMSEEHTQQNIMQRVAENFSMNALILLELASLLGLAAGTTGITYYGFFLHNPFYDLLPGLLCMAISGFYAVIFGRMIYIKKSK